MVVVVKRMGWREELAGFEHCGLEWRDGGAGVRWKEGEGNGLSFAVETWR